VASRKQRKADGISDQSINHDRHHHHPAGVARNNCTTTTIMATTERLFVLPGETIDPSLIPTHKKHPLRLGPGLRHIPPSDIVPTVAGQLITNTVKNSMWVEYNSHRVCNSIFRFSVFFLLLFFFSLLVIS
jgi:exosome complex component RRP40